MELYVQQQLRTHKCTAYVFIVHIVPPPRSCPPILSNACPALIKPHLFSLQNNKGSRIPPSTLVVVWLVLLWHCYVIPPSTHCLCMQGLCKQLPASGPIQKQQQ